MTTSSSATTFRLVCTYPDGELASAWFQAVRKARRASERAGYRLSIELLPASAAVADAGLLVQAPAELETVIARLVEEGRVVRGPESPRAIAVHRGFQAIGERARLGE
jgi:hypothetical protein